MKVMVRWGLDWFEENEDDGPGASSLGMGRETSLIGILAMLTLAGKDTMVHSKNIGHKAIDILSQGFTQHEATPREDVFYQSMAK